MEEPGPRLQAQLRKHAISISPERAGEAFAAEIAYYLEHHLEGRDERTLDALRDRCAAVLRDALDEPALDHATARHAMLASIRFAAYPDAAPALRALRSSGLRLVAASNWDCSLPRVLEHSGLAELLDAVVTSAQAGAAKPDRRFFDAALRVAGCHADEAIYVGDSPTKDLAGAAAAGIRAVLISREGRISEPPPVPAPLAVIARLSELAPLI